MQIYQNHSKIKLLKNQKETDCPNGPDIKNFGKSKNSCAFITFFTKNILLPLFRISLMPRRGHTVPSFIMVYRSAAKHARHGCLKYGIRYPSGIYDEHRHIGWPISILRSELWV